MSFFFFYFKCIVSMVMLYLMCGMWLEWNSKTLILNETCELTLFLCKFNTRSLNNFGLLRHSYTFSIPGCYVCYPKGYIYILSCFCFFFVFLWCNMTKFVKNWFMKLVKVIELYFYGILLVNRSCIMFTVWFFLFVNPIGINVCKCMSCTLFW